MVYFRNVEDAFMFMQETGVLIDINHSDEIRYYNYSCARNHIAVF